MDGLFVLEGDDLRVSFNKLDDNTMVIFTTCHEVFGASKNVDIETGRQAYSILLKRGYKRVRPNQSEIVRYEKEIEDHGEYLGMKSEQNAENAWLVQAEYDPESQHQMYEDDMRGIN